MKTFFEGPDRVMLAPMEGVVDSAMREVLTSVGGIDLCVTEFIRVTDRLLPEHEFFKDCPELARGSETSSGIPVLVQLLGGVPAALGENAARAVSLGARGIDLNFGCPAKTVNRHDGGATLLKNPSRIFDVVTEVRRAVGDTVPVSAKVRLGFSDKDLVLDIARAAASAGAAWLVVHARTRDEGYRPPAHWSFIGSMREEVARLHVTGAAAPAASAAAPTPTPMPVIANGEMWTLADIARARDESGCRHVMIGRGLLADPFLAREYNGGARGTWAEAFELFERYIAMSERESRGPSYAAARAKQWLKSLGKRFPQAFKAFEEIKRLETAHEIIAVLSRTLNETSAPEQVYTVSNIVTV